MQICFGFKNFFFFFNHKLHAGQILNFNQYLPKRPETLEIDRNDPKSFQSGIGTPWTKFLELPLFILISYPLVLVGVTIGVGVCVCVGEILNY